MGRTRLMRGSPAKALGCLLLCLVAALGFASTAYASGPSVPATITGYVKTSGGVGIPGVRVAVDGETSDTALWGFYQTAVTDATGKFVITDIIQGTYQMFVNEPNASHYETGYAEARPWGEDQANWPPHYDTRHLVLGGTTVDAGVITLATNGVVQGRAMDGATPVQGSEVIADIEAGGVYYRRWATTGADGRFAIPDAIPGVWSLVYKGTRPLTPGGNAYVPDDAIPNQSGYSMDYDPLTQSEEDLFGVTAGLTYDRGIKEFNRGQLIFASAFETYGSMSYNVGNVGVRMAPSADPDDWQHTYWWQVGDDGIGHAYMPPGTWDLTFQDGAGSYDNVTIPSITTSVGGTDISATQQLPPAPNTYALLGHISEASGVASLTAWVSASRIDPGSSWLEYFRRVPSTGATYGDYLIRLPKVTGYTGNRMKVTWYDQADPPDEPFKHVMYEATITPPAGTSLTRNISMVTGGKIAGTIHDSDGNLVPGVTVWAVRKAFDPSFGEIAWTGGDSWWTRTKANGTYEIGGLPAGTDYKINVNPDYNPGMALPIKYKDYNRRTYKGQPLVDSLNTSVGAAVSDHTPVGVALGGTTASIDETIFPGGYVALHADGPEQPTGAVWCDVMYLYKSHWFEIDSGYTTGGTFQKISKVLPTGHYKLMYSDYFKRGSGTWEFDLGPLEHKYASVLVPAPVTIESGGSMLKGAFAGLLGGGSGLPLGGAGGTLLNFKLGSVQTTWAPLPSGTFAAGSVFNATLSSGEASGTWTLTLPYDPSVADGDVPYLRVIHYKQSGGTETLSPIGWNTINHTIMVQTNSLSPFRVVYKKHTVKLGTPMTSTSTWKRYSNHTVYGSLSPKHTSGVKSVKIMVYRRDSKGHYRWYKSFSAPNYGYKGGTRYGRKFSLKAGKYHLYAYAYSDKWHYATKTTKYKYVYVK